MDSWVSSGLGASPHGEVLICLSCCSSLRLAQKWWMWAIFKSDSLVAIMYFKLRGKRSIKDHWPRSKNKAGYYLGLKKVKLNPGRKIKIDGQDWKLKKYEKGFHEQDCRRIWVGVIHSCLKSTQEPWHSHGNARTWIPLLSWVWILHWHVAIVIMTWVLSFELFYACELTCS